MCPTKAKTAKDNGEGKLAFPTSAYLNFGKDGLRYCELHKAIAEFYFTEETFWWKVKNWYDGNVPAMAYERYKAKIFDAVERIIPFGLSACIGEARYFYSEDCVYMPNDYPEKSKRYMSASVALTRICDVIAERLRKKRGCSGYYTSLRQIGGRHIIYGLAVPYERWLDVADDLVKVFEDALWRGESYGGRKWQEAAKHLGTVIKACYAWNIQAVVIATDTFINLCHNGGLLLNKFDSCGKTNVAQVLDAKKWGFAVYLGAMMRHRTCVLGCSDSNYIWRD